MKTRNLLLGVVVVAGSVASAARGTTTMPGMEKTIKALQDAGVAGAMQEYEDLKTLIAEIEADIARARQEVDDLENLGILQSIFGTEQLSEIQAQVDSLESQAASVLSAVAAKADREGNKAAGTRVRKQMQKIKQAAQEVRNRVLEIRSVSSVPVAAMALDICEIPVIMDVGYW